MGKKRGHGEGGVYQRADGMWVGQLDLGYDQNGKRLRKRVYAKRKASVLDKLTKARADHAAGVLTERDDRITVGKYLDDWLDHVAVERVRPKTLYDYRFNASRYIEPYLGRKKLARLSVSDVDRWLADLAAQGLSPRTRQYARSVLRNALKTAETRGLVARNVAALSTPPRMAQSKTDGIERFTEDEAARLLEAAQKHPLGAMVVVPLSTGMRKSEILGLLWNDLDLDSDNPTVRITGSITRVTGLGIVRTEAKTLKRRGQVVPLPAAAVRSLRDRKRAQAEERLRAGALWSDEGYVLTTPLGTPVDPRNAQRTWEGICKNADVAYRPQRTLRHSAAVLLLGAGVPLHAVSEILGHGDVNITKQVYAGYLEPHQRLAATAMDRILG